MKIFYTESSPVETGYLRRTPNGYSGGASDSLQPSDTSRTLTRKRVQAVTNMQQARPGARDARAAQPAGRGEVPYIASSNPAFFIIATWRSCSLLSSITGIFTIQPHTSSRHSVSIFPDFLECKRTNPRANRFPHTIVAINLS